MRARIAAMLVLASVACGPAPDPRPPGTGDSAWFCPKARFQTCFHHQTECHAAYPGDVCVLTRPVFCDNDTRCYATRYDCEYWSICYQR
jgi:hypothetical protein